MSKIQPNSVLLRICQEVDNQLNSCVHTLRKSNSHLQAKVHTRSVLNAANKIQQNAQRSQIPVANYITRAIESVLFQKRQLTIGSIAAAILRNKGNGKQTRTTFATPSDFPSMDPSLPKEERLGAMIAARTELDPKVLLAEPEIQKGRREGLIHIEGGDHSDTRR